MLTSNNFMSMISIVVMPVFPAMKKNKHILPKIKMYPIWECFFFLFSVLICKTCQI